MDRLSEDRESEWTGASGTDSLNGLVVVEQRR